MAAAAAAVALAVAAGDAFVTRSGQRLQLDGQPFYFAGANCYSLFSFGSGSGGEGRYMDRAAIDQHMAAMAAAGVTVVRTWAFNHEKWHDFDSGPGKYNEQEFVELDYVVASAGRHRLRVILTLENYWTAYGGIATRLKWAGQPTDDPSLFFTTAACTQQFKADIRHFVTRRNNFTGVLYTQDPTLLAWELVNEPRYPADPSGATLAAWHEDVGGFLKGLDRQHLLAAGVEGHGKKYGYGGDEGSNFTAICEVKAIDLCTGHMYPQPARLDLGRTKAVMRAWAADAAAAEKPFVLEEFNTEGVNRTEWWAAMFGVVENSGAAGDLFWWFAPNKTATADDYAVYKGAPELAAFKRHSAAMNSKSG
eukprot:TRINITY_DN746_c0_g3_i1.p2 TRINITY_DN746_c0_g3~~TRINITY_DN746_c0_g3_i1.p2  ORF type:complete len:381 (+),score=172.23 TRINITY_DN746_c0_g3_i1:54-1145(+)